MARTYKRRTTRRNAEERHFSARVLRRTPLGLSKLAEAFTGIELARIEAEAQAQHQITSRPHHPKEADHDHDA